MSKPIDFIVDQIQSQLFELSEIVRLIVAQREDLEAETLKELKDKLIEKYWGENLQPVCQNNFYDYDTGECHHSAKRYQCSNFPYCNLKVGTPIIRGFDTTARK